MRSRAALALALAAAVAYGWHGVARADDDPREESRAAFRRGVAAIEKQDWPTARTELEHAYTLFPHPSILLDLGLARARTEAWVLAETALVRFLADDSGAATDEVETARRTLVEVKSHLGTLRLKVEPANAAVAVDGEPVTLVQGGTTDVRVVLGDHKLHAEAPAYVAQDRSVAVAATGADASIVLVPTAVEGEEHGPTSLQIVGYSLLGVSAVSLGIGIFAGVRALDLAHQYSTVGDPKYQDADTKSTGITFRTLADVTLIGGAALAAAGIVLAFVVHPGPTRKPAPALAFGPGSVSLRVSFE